MSASLATPRGRLRHYLLRWTLGTLVLVWLALVGLAWSTGFHEARNGARGDISPTAGSKGDNHVRWSLER